MLEKLDSYPNKEPDTERQLRAYSSFSGSAEQLLTVVEHLAPVLHLEPESDSGNERLLRHYASVNVLDKPSRQGREAVYSYRHLLQFLAARRLMKQGFALSKIAEFTSVVPTETLQQTLCESPQRSEAELLVAAYRASRDLTVEKRQPTHMASTHSSGGQPTRPEPLYGMADVMHEIEKMRSRFMDEIKDMQSQVLRSLHGVEKTSDILNRLQMDSAKNLDWVLAEKRESQQRMEERFAHLSYMTEKLHQHTRTELEELNNRITAMDGYLSEISGSINELREVLLLNKHSSNPAPGAQL